PACTAGVAVKHAHSKDNPEADWGRHLRQAAEFALQALDEALPGQAPFTFDNTRVIAVGISNGGAAVLRAAEDADGWLDAVVAGARMHLPGLPQPLADALAPPGQAGHCAQLAAAGLVAGSDAAAQAKSAYGQLLDGGWTEATLRAGALSTGFDLWRSLAVTYASAYGRYGAGEHPCGHAFAAQGPDLAARAATPVERAAWWSEASGLPPGPGVGVLDPPSAAGFPALQRLRALHAGEGVDARRVQAGVAAITAAPPRSGLPVVIVHGADDGLIPMQFSSVPYAAAARAAGRDVRFWEVRNAQHFDAFLALPGLAERYVPLLPHVYA